MKINKIFELKSIHFIGIGGASMNGLAKIMLNHNINVTGSDILNSSITQKLKKLGVKVFIGHKSNNITKDIQLIVFSGAINKTNPEIIQAKKLNIKCIERSEFLWLLAKEYNNIIAVAGTHGKTTTTAILGKIFIDAKINPTIHLGGISKDFGSINIGEKKYFLTEACEFRNSFKYLKPNVGIITNIEPEHLDYYKNFDNLKAAFVKYANSSKEYLIINYNFINLVKSNNINIYTFGTNKKSDFYCYKIKKTKFGYNFCVKYKKVNLGSFNTKLFGKHNVINSLCAICVAYLQNIDLDIIRNSIQNFNGVIRRNETLGVINGVPIIADYAHHPNEIKSSIIGIKQRYKRVCVIFQPHTYSRTKTLLKEFKRCFSCAKHVGIYKTYSAREQYDSSADEYVLLKNIVNNNKTVFSAPNEISIFLSNKKEIKKYDCILILGAGDIYEICKSILE